MSRLEKGLAAITVVDFIGAVISGVLGAYIASLVMLGLLVGLGLLLWLIWLTREVVLLRKATQVLRPKARRYLEEPLMITASRKNRIMIDSDFLRWDECTIMLWIDVPARKQGLRNAPHNRYVLSHYTEGKRIGEVYKYLNTFAFRYSQAERWEVVLSGDSAEEAPSSPRLRDGLVTGWHHFLIAWDQSKPKLVLAIDGGEHGVDLCRSGRAFWPERLAERVCVGTWMDEGEIFYCETQLFDLLIFDRFLELNDPAVRESRARRPQA